MSEKYISGSQQRILSVLGVMVQAGLRGARSGEIAEVLHIEKSKVTRDMANLVESGWVEADVERVGVWRVTPKISRMAFAVMRDLQGMKERMEELEKRYVQ